MHNHHRYTSFSTFAKRVLGSTFVSEAEFESIDDELSFDYQIDENSVLTSKISSRNTVVKYEYDLTDCADSMTSSLLEEKSAEYLNSLKTIISNLANTSDEVVAENLELLAFLMRRDFGFLPINESKFFYRLNEPRLLAVGLDSLTNIALLTDNFESLVKQVVVNLESFLGNNAFVSEPRNIRCLQQILSVASMNEPMVLKQLSNISPHVLESSEDAYVAILISVASSSKQIADAFESMDLERPRIEVDNLERTIETLSRSPIKINFAVAAPYLQGLMSKLDVEINSHAKLLFRAGYFATVDNKRLFVTHSFVDVLVTIFSFKEQDFNELYRDVRRSQETPITESELYSLFERIDVSRLSTGKLVYLYSLLPDTIDESDKLSFYCRALIENGIAAVNSQESLTFSASLGLKSLSNQIINDMLRANQALPCLPENNAYSLSEVFSHVLESKSNKVCENAGLITVVITTFNPDLTFLEKAINSVFNQSYPAIELIVIDDCSDETISNEVKALCESQDSGNIIYHRNKENLGQYLSRNVAISLAKGEFIAIQDDDDVSHPERFAIQIDAIRQNSALACFTKHVRYSDDGSLSVDDPRNLLVLGDGPATLLFKRSLLELIGGFRNYRSRGDIDFRTRIESIAGPSGIVRVDIPLYFMRSSLTTVSSMYEYFNGDQLIFFRRRIDLLKNRLASEKV